MTEKALTTLDDLEREIEKVSRLRRANLLTDEEAYNVLMTKAMKAVGDLKVDFHYLELGRNEALMHGGEASEAWQRADKTIKKIRKICWDSPSNPSILIGAVIDVIQLYLENKEIPE